MSCASDPALLVVHAVRIKGMTDAAAISRRFALDRAGVEEQLLDHEALGLVQRAEVAGLRGWTLTERGTSWGEEQLAAELDVRGAREHVAAAHSSFEPVNARFLQAITRWQIRPTRWDAMNANDHTDWAWDERVLRDLAGLAKRLGDIEQQLSVLPRFTGYAERFAAALRKVDQGNRRWVDEPGVDSCHTVWFELHEDLLATLGLPR